MGAPQQLALCGLHLNSILPDLADGSLDFFSLQLRQHRVASLKWVLHRGEFEIIQPFSTEQAARLF